jgi:hypothetical protein
MPITLNQHRAGITQTLIDTFSDSKEPKQGLQAFFPTKTTSTKLVSIEVERNSLKVAVDVQRCTDPNRNTFSKSTEKIFQPPYFNESFDFTACERYDVTFGSGNPPTKVDAGMLIRDAQGKIKSIKDMITRSTEIQRASALQYGVVFTKNGDNIDYRRRAGSMVVLAGANKWDVPATSNPLADLKTGMKFIRSKGKSGASTINAIFGDNAFENLLVSESLTKQAAWLKINRFEINMPQFDEVSGMVFQGQLATGDYKVNVWTYNETYEDPADGVEKPYIEENNVVLVANDFKGWTAFAGVPAIMGDNASGQYVAPMEGEFYVRDIIDQVKMAWNFIVSSAPLAVVVSVDRVYTIKTA